MLGKVELIEDFHQLSHDVALCVTNTSRVCSRRGWRYRAFVKAAVRSAAEVISSRQYRRR